MRNRIEKARSEKGFTLVELLAVVVILGIILAIAIPAIGNVIAKQKVKAHDANQELILDSARIANAQDAFGGYDENGVLTSRGNTMSVDDLIRGGFLESEVESPWGSEDTYGGDVKNNDGKLTYTPTGVTPE